MYQRIAARITGLLIITAISAGGVMATVGGVSPTAAAHAVVAAQPADTPWG
jgi:hypothetical protein